MRCRDRLQNLKSTLSWVQDKRLKEKFEKIEIVVIDGNSTYGPLLEYYEKIKVESFVPLNLCSIVYCCFGRLMASKLWRRSANRSWPQSQSFYFFFEMPSPISRTLVRFLQTTSTKFEFALVCIAGVFFEKLELSMFDFWTSVMDDSKSLGILLSCAR